MSIAHSKRKLITATALFIAVGALTGAIATGGAFTVSYAQTEEQDGGGGATTGEGAGQQGGQQGRIVQQGTITSIPHPLPGHEGHQVADILPLGEEGSVYSGVITYTASVPVEVVTYTIQTLNETERAVLNATDDEAAVFGTLFTTQLPDNQTSITATVITPPYGETPFPSASIPFTGNALSLHTIDGTPFVASYAVSAQVLPAETQNNISNATLTVAADGAADEDGEDAAEDGAADEGDEGAAAGGAGAGGAADEGDEGAAAGGAGAGGAADGAGAGGAADGEEEA
ncbi:MAG: hypothetical protein M3M87_07590 [Thermoproteota archaeon]|nr:hypothetical protein [Thermoproteota archaeon]